MADTVRAYKFLVLIQNNDRVTVRHAQAETGLSRASVYRAVESLREILSIHIRDGVIVRSLHQAEQTPVVSDSASYPTPYPATSAY